MKICSHGADFSHSIAKEVATSGSQSIAVSTSMLEARSTMLPLSRCLAVLRSR